MVVPTRRIRPPRRRRSRRPRRGRLEVVEKTIQFRILFLILFLGLSDSPFWCRVCACGPACASIVVSLVALTFGLC